ncbi:hypothetical protein FGIG_02392 [Fasciola gigantica]|uniref:FMP27/BLTP2/Hobbit GFWDK motif-containing RBG unit domain-containing protein n=1 Tax=Fasciola gigantica TaxID=46835 RepID=A0A504YE27_FASGI|nr:hypothetical protein FGIG_02392 [Fasciola gigantica]
MTVHDYVYCTQCKLLCLRVVTHVPADIILTFMIFSQVLQDEQVKHEERLMALEEQLQWAVQSGIRISESDRLAYLTRMEAQRATEYRTRLHNFKQDYPTADELFTWTLNSVHLKILADSAFASPERVMDRIRQMDSCSPWPHLAPSDFVSLWCRQISLNVDRWRFQLRDYPKPWLEITDLLVWGPLAGAERLADWKDLKEIHMCYGANWEPTVAWVSQRLEDILPQQTDMSLPRLGWWDRVRHLLHGRIYVVSDTMHWLCSTSLNPYNATEFFAWQWNHSSVCWETGNFHLEGDLDILFHTASKYDGVCPILHLPRLEMNIQLDWLSLGDPLDHHSVRPCNTERLHRLGIMEHDSYRYFRGNRLAMRISSTVRPAVDSKTAEQQPSCLFYTSVLKFADKLRMCLTKVARPIRRGRIFRHTPHRKPVFGRLLQSLEFSLNLPQLELSYWVSYSKRTGVHVTTGPVQLVAVLRHTIELESKASFIPRRAIVLQPHVMLPPTNVGTVPGALIHRLQTNWAVVHLSSSLQDSRIQLRHRPDLPGQVVQMLLQSAGLLKEDAKTADTPGRTGSTDLSEEFILVPLLHYEQVAPTPLPPDASVRVHIPGRRVPNTANHNNSSNSVGPRGSSTRKAPEVAKKSGSNDAASPGLEPDPPGSILTNDASQLTHESLTPTHRLEVSDMKLRWTEHTRDLIYMLMDTYQHAQSLKRNLSARATQAFQLEANPSSARVKWGDAVRSGPPGMHSRVASIGSNFTSRSTEPTTLDSTSACPMQSSPYCRADQVSSITATMFPGSATGSVDLTDNNNQHRLGGSPQQSEVPTQSDRSWLPGLGRVPMLAQLLDEVDTVRFYAYCEEEPKQTDVMGQLQGLNICDQSPVTARNWHVELINSQLLLKTSSLAGYVLVTAARAKLNALAHPPIWRDAQLLTKSSLVGHLEGMQYFATVSQLSPGASDQWLPTADVSDWVHLNPSADEDALSGRPEVVGCGRSVGGVVNACVTSQTAPVTMTRAPSTHKHTSPVVFFDTKTPVSRGHSGLLISPKPVQLQRMISRCSCQVFYVHYEPADPVKLPAPHLIPPLPLDENDVVRTAEGADTVTILHHTLNICTNSVNFAYNSIIS